MNDTRNARAVTVGVHLTGMAILVVSGTLIEVVDSEADGGSRREDDGVVSEVGVSESWSCEEESVWRSVVR